LRGGDRCTPDPTATANARPHLSDPIRRYITTAADDPRPRKGQGTIDEPRAKPAGRVVVRTSQAALILALAALAIFALTDQHRVSLEARSAETANRLANVYQDARFWVGQDESLERKYRVEPSRKTLDLHEQSGDNLIADLERVAALDRTAAVKTRVLRLLSLHVEYERATARMFAATRAGDKRLVEQLDHTVTDPIFSTIQTDVYGAASLATRRAQKASNTLRENEAGAFRAGLIAVGLAVGLVLSLLLVIRRYRRAGREARAVELRRLSELALTDPLTELRNHRAFQEDIANELQRAARVKTSMTLALLDVNDLKEVNDTRGHQAGDEHLQALAAAIRSTMRASDRAYRVGGDEFAVILPAVGEWAGFQFSQRLAETLERRVGPPVRATAGIAQATGLRSKDDVIRDADRALISAKASGQAAALYTPDMGEFSNEAAPDDENHVRTLANALAFAVDAKDPYTRSHSQTVSNLCAAIGARLGLGGERLARLRVAGLLHDVGKIGIPDAILRKPDKLDAEEFEQMKTHTVLGQNIVLAAEMPERARWVRHHHERIDGSGYPDGLVGSEIPLEARIIHVADAFEAMTSDRPYRKAPGKRFAVEELQRNAGTQFDERVVEALLQVLDEQPGRADRSAIPVGAGAQREPWPDLE
jgi:diguanylate cyclase (GGDEF)-like protein